MNKIREVQRLNERELASVVPSNASWHTDYRDTAYIYIGGLPLELSEGDVITIFSQYGEPVWVRLMRDKETGKSRGFAWLKYEDQRSCDLAVDNLGGATVMGRMLAVDHTRYKTKEGEDEDEYYVGQDKVIGAARDASEDRSEDEEEQRPMLKEEIELAKLMRDQDDDDPMKAYMIEQKKEEVAEAKRALVKSSDKKDRSHRSSTTHHRSHHHRSHRSRTSPDEDDDDRDRIRKSHRHRDRSISPYDDKSRYRDRDYRARDSRPKASVTPPPSDDRRRRERRRSSTPPTYRSERRTSRDASDRRRR
ncbi:hypothetical protein AAFC00_000942 [Neodothiora populina]|uniref:RRM domain-containing protein n=1 Tax=Neodothiora populina TaxID=2781224 RepID=A0ABR3PM99_9PEZI